MLGANDSIEGFLDFGRSDSLFDRTIVQVRTEQGIVGLGPMSMQEMLMMIPSLNMVDGADYSAASTSRRLAPCSTRSPALK